VSEETLAAPSCAECGRSPMHGEVWRLYFADIAEVVSYCPACAEWEFGAEGAGLGENE
jgi:hypothetical protein